jgi:DNA repair protein RadC
VGTSPASKRLPDQSAEPLDHLTARDLLAEILGSRSRIAPSVLGAAWPDTLLAICHMTPHELAHLLGLSPGPARRLAAALELHRRLVTWSVPFRPIIKTPEDAMAVLTPMCSFNHERLWCLALDVRCRLIAAPICISQGDVDGTDAGPRAFFRAALQCGATTCIAAHNHPTGDLTPSSCDFNVTRRLVAAGLALDVPLVDHIIIAAGGGYRSLRREHPECFR